MSENMKGALWACGLMLPILFGVGWVADIVTRDVIGLMMISHGDDPREVISQPILSQMWPALIAMWLVSSAIVLGLAAAGFGGQYKTPMPPPPPRYEE